MNYSLLIVPVIAIALGLLVFFGCSNEKGKQAEVGLCTFFCGLLLFLWIVTFHGVR